ncbi:MAG: NAD-dependent succinate-semialdehyde dehydrogenase [Deltaproteobacteria bacterium]|nr:NAD-dependent succinate-semialdehyde dehydrogenase [Deltaproteobacteria bacterium]
MQSELIKSASYIAGNWLSAENNETFPVVNPATGEEIGTVPNCRAARFQEAFVAAQTALPKWSAETAWSRAAKLRRFYELILTHEKELAGILTLEQGKPFREAIGEIRYGASFVEWFAEEAKRTYGETIPTSDPSKRMMVIRQPVGVCAAITPWNFPNAMITRKMAPALAAGCTIVVKPAPETPLSALALAALAEKAEIPAGVFNVVTGDPIEFATTAMKLDYVRKVTFTGSTEVGKTLMRQAADTVKRMTLELGGNAPFLVFEDADVERAVDGAMTAKYRNGGQTCISVNRFIVHEAIADKFSSLLAEKSRALRVGNGMQKETEVGPLINEDAINKVSALLSDALAQGATLTCGSVPDRKSLFAQPTVLTGVSRDMRIWREEIFGPVAAIHRFSSEAQALELANDCLHGLASYVYTRDIGRAHRVSEGLQFGMVGINDSFISYPQAPFGGIKQSGFGREGGKQGIDEYLNIKYVTIGI